MTLARLGPLLPFLISNLMIVLGGWSLYRGRVVHRRKGRQAVERTLADRGETLVSIKEVPRSAFYETAGLSGAPIFEVHACTADGDERTYHWAYAPRVFPWQSEGLQRLNHGVWIAVA